MLVLHLLTCRRYLVLIHVEGVNLLYLEYQYRISSEFPSRNTIMPSKKSAKLSNSAPVFVPKSPASTTAAAPAAEVPKIALSAKPWKPSVAAKAWAPSVKAKEWTPSGSVKAPEAADSDTTAAKGEAKTVDGETVITLSRDHLKPIPARYNHSLCPFSSRLTSSPPSLLLYTPTGDLRSLATRCNHSHCP